MLHVSLGGDWRALSWNGRMTEDEAVGEFDRLVSWNQRLGELVSRDRCVVLSGANGRSWCAWQICRRLLTLDRMVRLALDGRRTAQQTAYLLADIAATFVEARDQFDSLEAGLPLRLATLARENRRTVFAHFLPLAPVPDSARSALASLEQEIKPLIEGVDLAKLDVPAILGELDKVSSGEPDIAEAIELLQELMIGD